MSASREKRQRQDLQSKGPSEKKIREQQEAAAAQKKKIINIVAAVVAVVAIAALLLWNSGIFQRGATAATIGSEKIRADEMQYYYNATRNQEVYYQQVYSQWGISMLEEPYQLYDTSSALGDDQVYNTETGETYAEHFTDSALESLKEVVALCDAAKKDNVQLSAAGKAEVEDAIASMEATASSNGYSKLNTFLAANFGKLVTSKTYRRIVERDALAGEYYNNYATSLSYTDEQYQAYADEHLAEVSSYDFRYVYISGSPEAYTDADGKVVEPTEEQTAAAMTAARAKAETMAEGLRTAASPDSAFNSLAIAALGEDSSYAKESANRITAMQGSDLVNSTYFDWLSDPARKNGDVTVIDSEYGFWVMLFLNRYLNTADTVDVRHILVKSELPADDPETEADESAGAPSEEQMEAAHVKAQALLDEFLAGDKSAESFAALAEANSDDGGSNANGGLYTYVAEGEMIDTFNAWIFDPARQIGDTGLVKNENANQYGWHVMYFAGPNGPKWHETVESALLSDDVSSWLDELVAPYEATVASGMKSIR